MIRNFKFNRQAVTGKRILVYGANGELAFEGKIMTTGLEQEGFRCHLIPKSDSQFARQYGLRVVVVNESFFNRLEALPSEDCLHLRLLSSPLR